MNYVSAVYGVVAVIIAVDWFARGRKYYRGQAARHEDVTLLRQREIVREHEVVR